MKVKEESEKVGLKLNIQKTKIMASGPIISWQINGETLGTVTHFIFRVPKSLQILIEAIKLKVAWFSEESYDPPRSILKSRNITLPTKVHVVKALVFPVITYGCKRWTLKKAEHRRIDAFELWCWRRVLRVFWIASRS